MAAKTDTQYSNRNIVITAATVHEDAIKLLGDFNLHFCPPSSNEEEIAEVCRDTRPVALMVRYGNISSRVISEAGTGLRVIAKHGVGVDNIDVAFAKKQRIPVVAANGSNSQAVAEHAICLLMACARRLAWLDSRIRAGHWDKDGYKGLELSGRILGLIGFGEIGIRVARIAHALGMEIQVSDPFVDASTLPAYVRIMDVDELLTSSDAISLHCPLTDQTRQLLSTRRISALKPNAIIINTARAGLIDDKALMMAASEGKIIAGIDCFSVEPISLEDPIIQTPNMILTPHIGGTTDQSYREMGVRAAENILWELRTRFEPDNEDNTSPAHVTRT